MTSGSHDKRHTWHGPMQAHLACEMIPRHLSRRLHSRRHAATLGFWRTLLYARYRMGTPRTFASFRWRAWAELQIKILL
jgi:hypothetical protein